MTLKRGHLEQWQQSIAVPCWLCYNKREKGEFVEKMQIRSIHLERRNSNGTIFLNIGKTTWNIISFTNSFYNWGLNFSIFVLFGYVHLYFLLPIFQDCAGGYAYDFTMARCCVDTEGLPIIQMWGPKRSRESTNGDVPVGSHSPLLCPSYHSKWTKADSTPFFSLSKKKDSTPFQLYLT
jgi:hypothetical protein